MKIFIRHAEKEYDNGKSLSYIHDPDITINGCDKAMNKGISLINEYGIPDKIITSPYLRCRSTTSNLLKRINIEIPIEVDNRLSEYLGNRLNERLDVHPETLKYKVPHYESFKDFKKRVLSFEDDTENLIWVVTHGLVIKTILKSYNIKVKGIDFLEDHPLED